jgi:hypothetical protein
MIKLIQCLRSRRDLDLQGFRRHWQEYEEHIRRIAVLSGAAHATLDTTLAVDANLAVVATRGTSPPFEGVAEISWERAPDWIALAGDPALRDAISGMQRAQADFVDLERSAIFFASAQALLPAEDGG